jgi:ABC-type multidrug transport system fused ATPase/permease subunit
VIRRGLATMRSLVRLHPLPFAIGVFGAVVYALGTVGTAWALGRVTDRVILPRFEQGRVATGTAVATIALLVGMGVFKAAGIITRRTFATIAVARIGATVRSRLGRHYQRVPFEFHQRSATGELLSHAGNDVEAAAEALSPVPFSIGVSTIVLTSVVWLLLTDVWLSLIALVVFPAIVVVNLVYQRLVELPVEEAQAKLGTVSAVAHESFDGALVVKALRAEELESARFRQAALGLRQAKVRAATLRATFETTLDALPTLAIVALLPVGAWRVDAGALTTGQLVGFVSLFTLLTWPLRLIGYVLGEMPRAVVAYDRIKRVMAEPTDPRHDLAPVGGGGALASGGARVDVAGLTYAYEPGRPVLADVAFTVAPGTTVALVGPTGSGKSTLLHLLGGLLPPQAGTACIDGRDLSSFTVDELSRTVVIAFQEAFLFGESVAENILLGDDGDEARQRMLEASRLAGADRFVGHLGDGYDTIVGERGATLSGGQRQRVALARALVRWPRLLLLDDATSAVDPTTEARILAALRQHLTDTTTLIVANRPSTIALADEVLFVEEGRLVDHGRHDELLARQPGYERLVRAYELDRAERGASLP